MRDYGASCTFEVANDVIECQNSDFLVAGYANIGFDRKFMAIRVDPHGNPLWEQVYNESSGAAEAVVQIAPDRFLLVGTRYPGWHESGDDDVWVLCISGDGSPLWNRSYGGSTHDRAHAAVACSDGGALIAGSTNRANHTDRDLWVIRIDAEGGLMWNVTYQDPGDDVAWAALACDQGFLVAGYSEKGEEGGDSDMLAIMIEPNGSISWVRRYGGPSNEKALDVAQSEESGFLLAGFVENQYTIMIAIRVDNEGNHLWNQTYPTGFTSKITSVAPCSGGFLLSGASISHRFISVTAIRIDENGIILWKWSYAVEDIIIFHSVELYDYSAIQLRSGALLIAGAAKTSSWFYGVRYKVLLIRLSDPPLPNPPVTAILFLSGYVLAEMALVVYTCYQAVRPPPWATVKGDSPDAPITILVIGTIIPSICLGSYLYMLFLVASGNTQPVYGHHDSTTALIFHIASPVGLLSLATTALVFTFFQVERFDKWLQYELARTETSKHPLLRIAVITTLITALFIAWIYAPLIVVFLLPFILGPGFVGFLPSYMLMRRWEKSQGKRLVLKGGLLRAKDSD